jgi:transposase
MEREWLEARLAEGRSIQSIADEAGKGASTVGYWINKHGLVAVGRARHSARGGIDEASLRELVEAGLSIRQIAERLDRSYSAVRYWLVRHGLATTVPDRRPPDYLWCDVHDVALRLYEGCRFRCPRCVSEAVSEGRRRNKTLLVAEAGGRCVICDYDRCNAALEFHHLDPAQKRFSISLNGATRSIAALRTEAAKCVLLCSTCHKEVEAGVTQLPFRPVAPDGG